MKRVGDWELHTDLGVLRRDGAEVQLTPRSMSVLVHLVERPGELVSADSLLDLYWPGASAADNAVAKAVSEIRQALGDDPKDPAYIKTVARRGYTLIAAVQEIALEHASNDAAPPVYKGSGPYVFISYARKDAAIVHPEINWLGEMGANVWYDKGIAAGSEWTDSLARAIENASLFIYFIYFITPDSAESQNCRNELNFAIEHDIPVVAVHLKKTDLSGGLSLVLSGKQAILKHDLPTEDYQQNLRTAVSTFLDRTLKFQAPTTKSRSRALPVSIAAIFLALLIWIAYTQDFNAPADSNAGMPISDEQRLAAMRSIAVMPFRYIGDSDEEDVFAMGLMQSILDQLTQVRRIRLASSTDSIRLVGEDSNTVGEQLNVAYLLDGIIREEADALHITTQLVRTRDGFQVWSKSFEGTRSGGFAAEQSLGIEIAKLTEAKLMIDVLTSEGWKTSYAGVNPDALEPYLAAIEEMERMRLGEGGNFRTYMALLNQAIAIDANFHKAHMRVAQTYSELHALGAIPLTVAKPAALAALAEARRSIEAIPSTSAGIKHQVSLFLSSQIQLYLELDYAAAEAGFNEYLKHYPRTSVVHLYLAQIALREGRARDALRHADYVDVRLAGSESQIASMRKAMVQAKAGDFESALETSEYALKLAHSGQDRMGLLYFHALSLVHLGRAEEAKPFVEEGWKLGKNIQPEIWVYLFAVLGEVDRARRIITDAPYPLRQEMLAWGYVALGDLDATFSALQVGIENQNMALLDGLLVASWWDPIRDDPRYDELLLLLDSKVTHTEKYLLKQDQLQF